MKKVFISIAAVMLVASCNQATTDNKSNGQQVQTTQDVQKPRDGVLIHITEGYNNPHKVLMPMKMAVMMAEDKDVLVYMDINSVELLVKGQKIWSMKILTRFKPI